MSIKLIVWSHASAPLDGGRTHDADEETIGSPHRAGRRSGPVWHSLLNRERAPPGAVFRTGHAPGAGLVPLAAGRAPSQRATIFNGVWGFAPHATTLEEVMRVAGTRWTIASSVEAAIHEVGLEYDAVRNAPFSTVRLSAQMVEEQCSFPCELAGVKLMESRALRALRVTPWPPEGQRERGVRS